LKGILLINLGTPDEATVPAVRRYLREFLSDPYVIDINPISRWLLVNLIIAPFRSPKSTKAYQKVWTDEGSPLMIHTVHLQEKLQALVGEETKVAIGMRYGNPSIASGVKDLRDCDEIFAVPLYPQYAGATTQTVLDKLDEAIKAHHPNARVHSLPPFYEDHHYINATASVTKAHLQDFDYDHVLMSYHGLPVHQLPCAHDTNHECVQKQTPCPKVFDTYPNCYRAHCYATSRALAEALNIPEDKFSVSFQSRLGKTPWIQPYTDEHVEALLEKGVKRLAVLCPSFVADCLETIEEIGMEVRDEFLEGGGEAYRLIPCINSDDAWVSALHEMLTTFEASLS